MVTRPLGGGEAIVKRELATHAAVAIFPSVLLRKKSDAEDA
jgi:hypothetical protein